MLDGGDDCTVAPPLYFWSPGSSSHFSSSADNSIPRPVTADLPTDAFHPVAGEGSPLLVGRDNRAAVARRGKFTLAALYAIQVFYSFFIM